MVLIRTRPESRKRSSVILPRCQQGRHILSPEDRKSMSRKKLGRLGYPPTDSVTLRPLAAVNESQCVFD
jgi:hypothetical protein